MIIRNKRIEDSLPCPFNPHLVLAQLRITVLGRFAIQALQLQPELLLQFTSTTPYVSEPVRLSGASDTCHTFKFDLLERQAEGFG